MSNNVPTPMQRCTLPWCDADHDTPRDRRLHWQTIADMRLDRTTVELRYTLEDQPDAIPAVHVLYGPDWSPVSRLAIPLPAAAALADVLALITVQTFAEFGAGLRHAAQGPYISRSTQW